MKERKNALVWLHRGRRPWGGGKEKKRGLMHSPLLLCLQGSSYDRTGHCWGERSWPQSEWAGAGTCFLPTHTLGKVPNHLAPALKLTVITPFSADPILFPQGSSVTSGSQSLPMLSCLSSD